MNITNISNVSESRLEHINFYTPLQQRALDILKLATLQSSDDVYVREFLQFNRVNDSEIHWLETIGYLLSAEALSK
jgi:hypothetical protein